MIDVVLAGCDFANDAPLAPPRDAPETAHLSEHERTTLRPVASGGAGAPAPSLVLARRLTRAELGLDRPSDPPRVPVVGLTGKDGGALAAVCDAEIRVPWSGYADRIQEVHIKCIHALIAHIEAHCA